MKLNRDNVVPFSLVLAAGIVLGSVLVVRWAIVRPVVIPFIDPAPVTTEDLDNASAAFAAVTLLTRYATHQDLTPALARAISELSAKSLSASLPSEADVQRVCDLIKRDRPQDVPALQRDGMLARYF